jgi:hypothetical protein
MSDPINPSHYKTGDIEAIDAMRACTTPEQFKGYLKLSSLKYLWRYEKKGAPIDDLRKARWFLDQLILEESL